MLNSVLSNVRTYLSEKLSATIQMLRQTSLSKLLGIITLTFVLHLSLLWLLSYLLVSAPVLQSFPLVQNYLGRGIFMFDLIMNVTSLVSMAYTANVIIDKVPFKRMFNQSLNFTQNAYNHIKSKMLTFQPAEPVLEDNQPEVSKINLVVTAMKDTFKDIAKNFLPIKVYVGVTNLLNEEKRIRRGQKALQRAYESEDYKTVDEILRNISSDTLYQYLNIVDYLGSGIIQQVTFRIREPEPLKRLVNLVDPNRRLSLFKSLRKLDKPYIHLHGSLCDGEQHLNIVMESLTKPERFDLMSQLDDQGNTPLMYFGIHGENKSKIESLMRHCPDDKVIDYLKKVNIEGMTALVMFVRGAPSESVQYLLSLIPIEERNAFFDFNAQGLKAIVIAKARNYVDTIKVLNEVGVHLPAQYENITVNELNQFMQEWSGIEGFKEEYGETPWETLGIASNASQADIKKAFRSAILFSHPDRKQNDPSAEEKSKKLIAAFQFLDNPDQRKKHIKIS